MAWQIKNESKEFHAPLLITGLPGIGNVGKTAVDAIIEQKEAQKVGDFFSDDMPHSVFVNESHLIEMPRISLYYWNNIFFLSGDAQPVDERGCYAFCHFLLKYMSALEVKEIITLGGIGLEDLPKDPKVYITGTNASIVEKYTTKQTNTHIFGVVGPIMGVTGLLLGLAPEYKMQGVSLLAQTFGHPMYLGLKASRALMQVIMEKLRFEMDLHKLEEEIEDFEQKMKLAEELGKVSKERVNYIG